MENKEPIPKLDKPSTTGEYFSSDEIKEFKNGSLNLPLICYTGTDPNNVTQVTEVVAIGGMADNEGIPTEITMYKHTKGKGKKVLVYKLVQ